MRIRRSLGLHCTLASLVALSAGCKDASQLVLGFATDLSAPDRLNRIEMRVTSPSGTLLAEQSWTLPGQLATDFSLPGSFALFSEDGGEPTVNVQLVGKRGDASAPALLTRQATVSFASERTLFVRMALVDRCMGMSCGDGSTCVEGKCRPVEVNTVSLLPYREGMEAQVACSSQSRFIDTATKQAMPTEGDGYCGADEWCGESTCYRNQGQGLLWCNPPGSSCDGVDGYEECVLRTCATNAARCYGPAWRDGSYSEACADYGTCRAACHCDEACIARCDQDRSPPCASCLSTLSACMVAAGSTCAMPSCSPMVDSDGGSPADGGVPLSDTIAIPSGMYVIGCSPSDPIHPDPSCASDAQPAHIVDVPQFHIDRLEVSQFRWSRCVVAGRCTTPDYAAYAPATTPDLPVVNVTWDQASAFCAWAGEVQGKQGRLPYEAEWEAAAHGAAGATGPGTVYPFGDVLPSSGDCARAVTTECATGLLPVGQRPAGASPFGVEDMAGNAVEWVGDWYDPMSYVLFPILQGPSSGTERGKRGGAYTSEAAAVTATIRYSATADTASDEIGLRCAYIP